MKKIVVTILCFFSFLAFSQENNSNLFLESLKMFSDLNKNELKFDDQLPSKNRQLYFQDNLKTLTELQNNMPKLTYGKQTLFYTKNEFSGLYNVYSSVNGEVRLYGSYFSTFDFTPTCGMPGPVSNGDAGDLVGAIIHSFLSDLDLKFKIGKRHTISFF